MTAHGTPGVISRPRSEFTNAIGTTLIAKIAATQSGELPKFTCSASVGVPTEAMHGLKYSEPRWAVFLPPFRPSSTAAGSFFRGIVRLRRNLFLREVGMRG